MDKLKMHSPNFTDENIAKLAELFPNCATESTDAKGNLQRAIDFDQLRQELSDSIVDGPQERYQLNWPGKREALLTANAPIAKTLRPCKEESVDFDTTKNLFIEGDNLDALKLLQETYLGQVKMIYIDPPYNTGKDFIYADNFAETTKEYLLESEQKDEEGNRLVANTDSNGRFHSDWLSMMYSRLKLARNLLKDDGVIFISIDDGEQANLKRICEEIFGKENFLAQFIWKCRQFADARSVRKISTDHEYVICYAKSSIATLRGVTRDESKFSNPDEDPRGAWMSRSILGLATKDQRPNLHYSITDPETGIIYDSPGNTGWRYAKERMVGMIKDGRILFPKKSTGRPREKKFREELTSEYISFPTVVADIYTSHGTATMRSLFEVQLFDFPKPYEIIKKFVEQCLEHDETVIDFFAGSSSTAHAVMQLNAEDKGNRKFIMVQLPEPCDEKSEAYKAGYSTIAEISKERIRRAGKKIKDENPTAASNLDTGFRVLKVDSSNMAEVYYTPDMVEQKQLDLFTDNIKPDRTAEDLLFQVLLDWGVDLTLAISRETVAGNDVFFVDGNALAACFVKNGEITEDFCKELATREPLRVVFRDAGFKDDNVKINVEQIFKLMSPHTEVKTI